MGETDEGTLVISKADHFGRVPMNLLLAEGVTSHECRLYAYLTTFDFRQRHECGPGRPVMAEALGWPMRTLDRTLQQLEERQAIKRRRRGRGNTNTILLLADTIEEAAEGLGDESPDLASQADDLPSETDESPDRESSPPSERDIERETSSSSPNGDGGVEIISPHQQDAERLCEVLADHCGTLHAEAKRPKVTKAWVRDMEKMLRLDERDPAKVARLIAWVHQDGFWASNIRSPAKLRAQYDQLVAKANEEMRKRQPHVRDVDRLLAPISETG